MYKLLNLLVLVQVVAGGRNYLEQCVIKYQAIMSEVCQADKDMAAPCFSDDVTEQYGHNAFLTSIKLGFECCDLTCSFEHIKKNYCCQDASCRQKCLDGSSVKSRSVSKTDVEDEDDDTPIPASKRMALEEAGVPVPEEEMEAFRRRHHHHHHKHQVARPLRTKTAGSSKSNQI